MAYREIPAGSVEIQTGLWAYPHVFSFGGNTYTQYILYSAEGYCFWQVSQGENYDDEGNLLPPEYRIYATYAATAYSTIEDLNADFISVPYEEGYEVVSAGSKPETA